MAKSIGRLMVSESASIAGAALLIGASSLLSRLLGVLRERLLVAQFGVGDNLDAYYASFQAPNFLFNLLVLGTLSVAFIPVFVEWWERDKSEAWKLAAAIFNAAALVMGLLSLLMLLFAPAFVRLVAPGFSGEKFALTVTLTRILAFSPLLFAISSVFGSVLNARRRFVVVSLAPLVYNLAIIIGILAAAPKFGIAGVAASAVAGAALHAAIQCAAAVRVGFRFGSGLALRHSAVRTVWKLFFPRIWGIDISQISVLVGTVIGSTLITGSVALFNLATNIQTVPVAVLGFSFSIAAFPVFATALARGERSAFLDTFSRTARQIIFFLLPLGAMTVVLRAHVIRLVIGTRNLSWDDTRLAAAALALFAASFFLQGLTPLLSRAFYALKNTVTPVVVSGISVAANVALAYGALEFLADPGRGEALRALFRLQGVPDLRMLALPLAFSAASAVQTILLAVLLRLAAGPIGGRRIASSALKTVAASAVALLATRFALAGAAAVSNDRTFLGILVQTLFASTIGGSAYLLVALAIGSEEAAVFISSLRRKMLRLARPLGLVDTTEMR